MPSTGDAFVSPAGREVALAPDGNGAALLVIDLQKFTVRPENTTEYQRAVALPRAISAIQKLQRAFRNKGSKSEVIFTVIESLTKDGRDRGLDYKLSGFNVPKGSEDAQVLEEIAPTSDEIVLPKTSSSVFISTNIDYVLRSLNVTQVVIVGGLSDQCVSSAVRDACDLGYLVTLVTDACVAKSEALHNDSILHIKGYCRRRTADEVVAELGGYGPVQTPSLTGPRGGVHSAKFTRLLWVDLAGKRLVRVVPADRAGSGVGVAIANTLGTPSFGDVMAPGSGVCASGTVRMTPAAGGRGPRSCPWHPAHAYVFTEAMQLGAPAPSAFSARALLTRALEGLRSQNGLEVHAGFEIEFTLFEYVEGVASSGPTSTCCRPVDHSSYCCSRALDARAALLDEIVEALECMGIGVTQFHAESAAGQFEISLVACSAMEAVEDAILAREAICAVAERHGVRASFLPKLEADAAGTGCHVHLSLWRDGMNVVPPVESETGAGWTETRRSETGTVSGGGEGVFSDEARRFVLGVVAKLPALLAVTTPSPNSFRRLGPGAWSGAYQCWGVEGRECPVRACLEPSTSSVGRAVCQHFEVKALDATANPFLALAAIIFAGTCGMRSTDSEGAGGPGGSGSGRNIFVPHGCDPGGMADDKRPARLPTGVEEAWRALEADADLTAFLGADLLKGLSAVRREEARHFGSLTPEAEVEALRFKY